MLPSFIAARALISVPMNGILVPFKTCVSNLPRFCVPLTFHNEDTAFELSPNGSAFLLRVGGQNFSLSSRHQLGEGIHLRKPEEAILAAEGPAGATGLTCNEAITVTAKGEDGATAEDFLLLRFEDRRGEIDLAKRFLQLDTDQIRDASGLTPEDKVIAHITIGFPSAFTGYDYAEGEEDDSDLKVSITSRWIRLYLEPAASSAFDELGLTPYTSVHDLSDLPHPDGLSGSPVFMIWQSADLQVYLALAGVVLFASKVGRFNVYPAARLKTTFERLTESPAG